ncbi:MAG: L-lysine 2,3-aminomutase [candidate division WS2 bacterium]|uniref:L-lysine 2,3-aminomutase n=1 Tax=Psychracetigena formicireducens TaxID=2986056 RepID=A0A9E2BEM1_PSYF1|nr:L-lysine 2,3-aminomutase [Candidatus Psychracetigena formicireducens]MBT9144196.1 L-lysine 2,3-aminomutase [Candidatus Psychracetigena formicireducens]
MRNYKDIDIYREVTQEEWEDWKWQIKNRITSLEELEKVINLTNREKDGIKETLKLFRMAITPYWVSLMDADDPECPIRKQAVPTIEETMFSGADLSDPLAEDLDSPVKGITHRYPDRVLLLITDVCGMYCRHCTRRRLVGKVDKPSNKNVIDQALNYLRNNTVIRDVLLSGGDPLLVDDTFLEYILAELRNIKHVEIIRIGSRIPVVLPQRITTKLVNMLEKYHPLWMNIQVNHPKEITPRMKKGIDLLLKAGIPLGNQGVLLKGINDCPYLHEKLVHELVKIRVRPYYLYQCDLSQGIEHFRTSVGVGIKIIEHLRGHTSGFAVPNYIIDAPGGGGKIPVSPQYVLAFTDDRVILRNYEGGIFSYPEPRNRISYCQEEANGHLKEGVAAIMDGNIPSLLPEGNKRMARRKKPKDKNV